MSAICHGHELRLLPVLAAGLIACGDSAQPVVATKLAFTLQPTNTIVGAAMTPVVQVAIQDASGNAVTGATNAVTIALGTNPGAGSLSGTLTAAATLGTATFSNLRIDHSGGGYTLAASAGGLSGATSVPFTVDVDPNTNAFMGIAKGVWVIPAATDTAPRGSVDFNPATLAYTYAISVAPSGIIDSIAFYQNAAGDALRATASVILCAGVAACGATSGTATLVAPATTASIRASLIAYGTQLVFFTTTAQKAAGGAIRGTMFPTP